jgi:type II secretory pathway component GspD/PulD (secretin)
MNVVPHITADGAVQMKIDIKGDSPGIAITGSATRKTTRQLTTTMLKRSGETAVIGGLYTSTTSRTQRGIPYLSNLPLFGALFRSTEKTDDKKDLLIMVTPTIVGGGSASSSGSAGADAGLMPPINGTGGDGFGGNKAAPSQQSGGNQQSQSQNAVEPIGQSSNASMQSNELE